MNTPRYDVHLSLLSLSGPIQFGVLGWLVSPALCVPTRTEIPGLHWATGQAEQTAIVHGGPTGASLHLLILLAGE